MSNHDDQRPGCRQHGSAMGDLGDRSHAQELKRKRESAKRRRAGRRRINVEYDEEALGKAMRNAGMLDDPRDFKRIPEKLQRAIDIWATGVERSVWTRPR